MKELRQKYHNLINTNKYILKIKEWLNSYIYPFVLGLIVVISNVFALEVLCYSLIFALGSLTILFSEDTKPLIPILLTFCMCMSYKNGISYSPPDSISNIYDNPIIIGYFIFLVINVALFVLARLFLLNDLKKLFNRSLYLLPGLLALSVAYLLGGVGSNAYSINDFLFATSNALMLLGIFILFADTAFDKNTDALKYLSYVAVMTTSIIILQMMRIYICQVEFVEGSIEKWTIVTGWGCHNNFAGYLLICFPFIFYLMIKEKNRWFLYQLLILVSSIAIVLTESRNGIIILIPTFIISQIIFLWKNHNIKTLLYFASLILIGIGIIIWKFDTIYALFNEMIETGLHLNGRDTLYKVGWQNFLNNMIFGSGWFGLEEIMEPYIPPLSFAPQWKYHNFIIQILASCGIFGAICFVFLFINIVYLLFKKQFIKDRIVIILSITLLLATSFVDNFFYDYGFERYFAIMLCVMVRKKEDQNELILNN